MKIEARTKENWGNVMKKSILMLCLFLVGCATVGTRIEGDKLAQIKEGTTTKAEVISLLGKPREGREARRREGDSPQVGDRAGKISSPRLSNPPRRLVLGRILPKTSLRPPRLWQSRGPEWIVL